MKFAIKYKNILKHLIDGRHINILKKFFILCDKILIIISPHYNMTIIAQFSKSITD